MPHEEHGRTRAPGDGCRDGNDDATPTGIKKERRYRKVNGAVTATPIPSMRSPVRMVGKNFAGIPPPPAYSVAPALSWIRETYRAIKII
jgi:hypothetical protein